MGIQIIYQIKIDDVSISQFGRKFLRFKIKTFKIICFFYKLILFKLKYFFISTLFSNQLNKLNLTMYTKPTYKIGIEINVIKYNISDTKSLKMDYQILFLTQ